MTPKGRNTVNRAESSTESYVPKSNTAASVSSRRGDFSPTVRSRQRQNGGQRDDGRSRWDRNNLNVQVMQDDLYLSEYQL